MRRAVAVSRFKRRVVTHRFGDVALTLLLADPLAEGWYDHDWDALPEVALLRAGRLREGARVFDIGAHQCVVALILTRIVEPGGSVVAIEANTHNAHIGVLNRDLNRANALVVLNCAAARNAGQVMFSADWNGSVVRGRGERGRTSIRARTVDDLATEYGTPDVLFIDVEGFECEVLAGAGAVMRSAPDCFVEVHVGAGLEEFGGSLEALVRNFPQSRYKLYMAKGHPQSAFIPFDVSSEVVKDRFFLVALSL